MSVIDEIKDRLDIVAIVSPHVPLRKAGKNFKGVCPFHQEKTASFVVYPDDWGYHCFGCGAHGSGIDFVMATQKMDFGEALRYLAEKVGVPVVERRRDAEADVQRERLYRINEAAAQYFFGLLTHQTVGRVARDYLESRGLSRSTWESFQLGYAADSWDALLRYLQGRGFEIADLTAAGLLVEREEGGGVYDRFRHRLMFPIRDRDGHLSGFGARAFGDAQPKYLNSPQTMVFDKGAILYGIDKARAAIRRLDQVILMEGYFDVVVAHQHGVENAVACMGTALTDKQMTVLKRLTKNLYFALDADAAGDRATLRGLELSREVLDRKTVPVPTWRGLIRYESALDANIRIIEMPVGKDPDEVIGASVDEWRRLVGEALPVIDYLFRAATSKLDLSDPRAKSEAVDRLLPAVREIPDAVVQAHYVQRLARITGVSERSLYAMLKTPTDVTRRPRTVPSEPAADEPTARRPAIRRRDEGFVAEQYCLALLLQRPSLRSVASSVQVDDFLYPGNREIATAWLAHPEVGELSDNLDPGLRDRFDELRSMPLPGVDAERSAEAVDDCLKRLRKRAVLRQDRELVERELAQAAEAGDLTKAAALSERIADFNRQLTEVLNVRFQRKPGAKRDPSRPLLTEHSM